MTNKTTASAMPRSTVSSYAGVISAALLSPVLVGQLYDFEKMGDFISTLLLVSSPMGDLLAALLVAFELLALPYLLNMNLSSLMKIVSAVSGFGIVFFWLYACFTVWARGINLLNIYIPTSASV